jgi:hypothetical protein
MSSVRVTIVGVGNRRHRPLEPMGPPTVNVGLRHRFRDDVLGQRG